jgi:hypothetical protein
VRFPKRTSLLSAIGLLLVLAGGGLVAAAPAHADTAVTCNDTSSPDGTIYGCMAAQRAMSWINANGGQGVIYDTGGLWPDPAGVTYRTDCSGFVSMALHLTPTGLAALNSADMYEANGFVDVAKDSLQQGDILTNPIAGPDGHVVLFDHWTDSSHSAYWGFEQHGPTGSYGTAYRIIQYPYDPGHGSFYPQHYTKLAGATPPPPVSGSNASSSSTVVLHNGTISHFTRDVNGHVWDSSITAAGVIQPAYDLTGNNPHTPATKGTPTAAVAPNGTVDVITTDANGHVINTPINANGTLGPVYDLTANAGKAGGIPAASGNASIVVKSDGTAVVIDRASTGNVWTIAWGSTSIGPAYDWTANSPHTPATNGTPTAAVTPGGTIDIISTDSTGHVINSPWNANGTLGPVYDLTANAGKAGGIAAATGNASIVVKSDGTAVVLDRASTGNVWSIAWGSTSIGPAYDWTANAPHTPSTNGTPTAALTPGGAIDIISTDDTGHVINSPWNANGTLGPVYDLTANAGKSGGIAAASGNASIVVQSNGNATVFDAASTHEVWSIAWGPTFIGPAYDWTANTPHTPLAY